MFFKLLQAVFEFRHPLRQLKDLSITGIRALALVKHPPGLIFCANNKPNQGV